MLEPKKKFKEWLFKTHPIVDGVETEYVMTRTFKATDEETAKQRFYSMFPNHKILKMELYVPEDERDNFD